MRAGLSSAADLQIGRGLPSRTSALSTTCSAWRANMTGSASTAATPSPIWAGRNRIGQAGIMASTIAGGTSRHQWWTYSDEESLRTRRTFMGASCGEARLTLTRR